MHIGPTTKATQCRCRLCVRRNLKPAIPRRRKRTAQTTAGTPSSGRKLSDGSVSYCGRPEPASSELRRSRDEGAYRFNRRRTCNRHIEPRQDAPSYVESFPSFSKNQCGGSKVSIPDTTNSASHCHGKQSVSDFRREREFSRTADCGRRANSNPAVDSPSDVGTGADRHNANRNVCGTCMPRVARYRKGPGE